MNRTFRPILGLSAAVLAAVLFSACGRGDERSSEPEPGPPVYMSRFGRFAGSREWGSLPPSDLRVSVGSRAWERFFDTAEERADWMAAGEIVELRTAPIPVPFAERVWFDIDEPSAFSYGLSLERGSRYPLTLRFDGSFVAPHHTASEGEASPVGVPGGALVIELYQLNDDSREDPVLVESWNLEPVNTRILLEPNRDGQHLLRVQALPDTGGLVDLDIRSEPVYLWPVAATDVDEIIGVWGDPREGGRRMHEGIDIYGDYGTPLYAMTDALVVDARVSSRGGNSVILYDERRDIVAFYAHLQDVMTVRGARVAEGEQIGTVGATGNANPLYPHLHIGLSDGRSGRSFDPLGFFALGGSIRSEPDADPPEASVVGLTAESPAPAFEATSWLPGTTLRLNRDLSFIAAAPGVRERFLGYNDGYADAGTAFRLVGGTGNLLRMQRPDIRTVVYLPADALEPLDGPIGEYTLSTPAEVHARPAVDGRYAVAVDAVDIIEPGTYEVYARYENAVLLRIGGRDVWLRTPDEDGEG